VTPTWLRNDTDVIRTQCIVHEATSTAPIAAARTARSQHIIVDTASNHLAPPVHGPPPTCSVSTLLGLIRHKDRNCITSFSGRTPRATLWSILTADRHEDAVPCAQPAHHHVQRKDYAGSQIPRRWFRDRPNFNGQYNSHSIISYSTTDLDHPDYTIL
jgi:hypothetical protein